MSYRKRLKKNRIQNLILIKNNTIMSLGLKDVLGVDKVI